MFTIIRELSSIDISLKLRVLLASGTMLLICVALIMLSVMTAFESAQYDSIKKELAADANVLLTAARIENGQLVMPDKMPDERFNQVESEVLGVVYDPSGHVLWRSRSTLDEAITYVPDDDHVITEFNLQRDPTGHFFFYDIDVVLDDVPLIFVTLIPATEYLSVLASFRRSLLLWLMLTALTMLLVVWSGMHWSLKPIKQLTGNLKDIEQGVTDRLANSYPKELSSLTDGLNQLLANERKQREKYRDAMADLAHSLKTPLAVLQSVQHSQELDQRRTSESGIADNTVEEQVQRMNQIISYQLQRAVTRHRGLVKNHIDVRNVIDRICNTLNKVYQDKQVSLTIFIEQDCVFTGDEQDLMEVVGNLLENAYRLCLETVSITAKPTVDDSSIESLELVIEDDGQGIPVNKRQNILKRGVRADSRTPGQGIGLAVAMEIIDSYEGTLAIEDSRLGGALFRIKLIS